MSRGLALRMLRRWAKAKQVIREKSSRRHFTALGAVILFVWAPDRIQLTFIRHPHLPGLPWHALYSSSSLPCLSKFAIRSPSLTWEVLERIIGHSGDHPQTLLSFSLTCRGLSPRALCFLVADVHSQSPRSVDIFDFCDFLQAKPHLTHLVHSIVQSWFTLLNGKCRCVPCPGSSRGGVANVVLAIGGKCDCCSILPRGESMFVCYQCETCSTSYLTIMQTSVSRICDATI